MNTQVWKKCSSCKAEIFLAAKYYECSVSTCTGKRTGLVFCSVACWERHLPGARHRDASAIEERAPKVAESVSIAEGSGSQASSHSHRSPMNANQSPPSSGARRILRTDQGPSSASSASLGSAPKDILIVVSKLKDYVKARGEMNTSGDVAEVLSERVRKLCDEALDQARSSGRKTLMGRDFKS